MKFECGSRPARSLGFYAFPIQDILKPYKPIQFRWSLFQILPLTSTVRLIKYIAGSGVVATIINRLIFFINVVYFFFTTVLLNIITACVDSIEQFVYLQQSALFISIVLMAAPISTATTMLTTGYLCQATPVLVDSLAAIKNVLYEDGASLLLVSVIGLLVALVGSAVLTRSSQRI